jgi:hypothetical protein
VSCLWWLGAMASASRGGNNGAFHFWWCYLNTESRFAERKPKC